VDETPAETAEDKAEEEKPAEATDVRTAHPQCASNVLTPSRLLLRHSLRAT
jgi:hypothetical protein